jgi:hypothetical protein
MAMLVPRLIIRTEMILEITSLHFLLPDGRIQQY